MTMNRRDFLKMFGVTILGTAVSTNTSLDFVNELTSDTYYKEFLAENRGDHDLMIFIQFKKSFFKDKNITIAQLEKMNANDFIKVLAVKHEIGTYFHNEHGPAYGVLTRHHDSTINYKHEEYWLNGKRILDNDVIAKMKPKV